VGLGVIEPVCEWFGGVGIVVSVGVVVGGVALGWEPVVGEVVVVAAGEFGGGDSFAAALGVAEDHVVVAGR